MHTVTVCTQCQWPSASINPGVCLGHDVLCVCVAHGQSYDTRVNSFSTVIVLSQNSRRIRFAESNSESAIRDPER